MLAELPLSGRKVLVTRPQQQAKALAEMITQQGGDALCFPVIQIDKLDVGLDSNNSLIDADVIIFVSRNAVHHFFSEGNPNISTSTLVVAVGKGTTDVLEQQGISNVLRPTQAVGSEGVLMLAELKDVADKNIVIVRGRGGRELLADTLASRGAKISYIEVYERKLPSPTVEQCTQACTADIIVCTSAAGVTNLCALLNKDIEDVLIKPLVVLSDRIKQHALSLGFKDVMISADASDQAVIQRLMEMER